MNDWNYTKKVGKLGLIYGLTLLLFPQIALFLIPDTTAATDPGLYLLRKDINSLAFILAYFLVLPLAPVLSLLPSFSLIGGTIFIPLTGAVFGAIFGFLIDLYKNTKESGTKKDQREKGVFVRIPFGSKKIIISEKFVNCFIIAWIILLVFFTALNSSGIMDKAVVDGIYWERGSSDHTLIFYKNNNTFGELYPNSTTENGTYKVNQTLLTLYYSNGKIVNYNIENDGFVLSPANKAQFSSEEEWEEKGYMKPRLM